MRRSHPPKNFTKNAVISAFSLCAYYLLHPVSLPPSFDDQHQPASCDQPWRSPAGIVFSGTEQRLRLGLKLYQECKIGQLFISGIEVPHNMSDLLKKYGLSLTRPLNDITIDRLAANTHENALNAAAWIKSRSLHEVVLVTSSFHMPRSYEFLKSITVDLNIKPKSTQDAATTGQFLDEYLKLVCARLGYPATPNFQWGLSPVGRAFNGLEASLK